MKRNGGSVFPAPAKPGDPFRPSEACSLNEDAGALISTMAPSTIRSNQRPDTLMQDRKPAKLTKRLTTQTIHMGHSRRFVHVHTTSGYPSEKDHEGEPANLESLAQRHHALV
jgi:hypothetical protein